MVEACLGSLCNYLGTGEELAAGWLVVLLGVGAGHVVRSWIHGYWERKKETRKVFCRKIDQRMGDEGLTPASPVDIERGESSFSVL